MSDFLRKHQERMQESIKRRLENAERSADYSRRVRGAAHSGDWEEFSRLQKEFYGYGDSEAEDTAESDGTADNGPSDGTADPASSAQD